MGLYSLNVSTVSIGVALQTLVAMYLIIIHDNYLLLSIHTSLKRILVSIIQVASSLG